MKKYPPKHRLNNRGNKRLKKPVAHKIVLAKNNLIYLNYTDCAFLFTVFTPRYGISHKDEKRWMDYKYFNCFMKKCFMQKKVAKNITVWTKEVKKNVYYIWYCFQLQLKVEKTQFIT